MTKISQLSDIGDNLAGDDEFIIRDVSDASTPNKKVTASGFFAVASDLGLTGLDRITAGSPVASGTQTRVYASGVSGYSETTVVGIASARTTISGYFENASGVASGVFYPVVTQVDIGTAPNEVPLAGMLGTMAFQDAAAISVDQASITDASITEISNIPLLTGGGLKFSSAQIASADPNTLDDYEEGTWTPIVIGTSTAGTGTYAFQNGRYTKIGRLVQIVFNVRITAHTGTGNIQIGGIPFAAESGIGGNFNARADDLTYTGSQVLCYLNVSTLDLLQFSSASSVTAIPLDTSFTLRVTGTYNV